MSQELTAAPIIKPLTPRKARFCAEYVIDFKGQAAAIRAGAPPRSASVRACEWLKEPAVQAEIERLQADILHRIGVTSFGILRETAAIAHSNVLDYLPALGLQNSGLEKLTREQGAAIKEVEIEEFEDAPLPEPSKEPKTAVEQAAAVIDPPKPKLKRRIILKLAPKTPALDLLGRHAKCWGNKDESDGPTFINNQVNVTIRRVGA